MARFQTFLKKSICISLLWLLPVFLFAQTEFGLLTSNMHSFQGVYKKVTNDQSIFRVRMGIVEANINNLPTTVNTSASIFLAFGWEKRITIGEKLQLYTGPEPRLSLSHARNNDLPSASLSFGLGYIIGLSWTLGFLCCPSEHKN